MKGTARSRIRKGRKPEWEREGECSCRAANQILRLGWNLALPNKTQPHDILFVCFVCFVVQKNTRSPTTPPRARARPAPSPSRLVGTRIAARVEPRPPVPFARPVHSPSQAAPHNQNTGHKHPLLFQNWETKWTESLKKSKTLKTVSESGEDSAAGWRNRGKFLAATRKLTGFPTRTIRTFTLPYAILSRRPPPSGLNSDIEQSVNT